MQNYDGHVIKFNSEMSATAKAFLKVEYRKGGEVKMLKNELNFRRCGVYEQQAFDRLAEFIDENFRK